MRTSANLFLSVFFAAVNGTSSGVRTRVIGLSYVTCDGKEEGRILTVETCAVRNGSGKLDCTGPHGTAAKGSTEIAMLAVKLRARGLAAMMHVNPEAEGFTDLTKNDVDVTALTLPNDPIDGGSGRQS